ncbi:Helix-turn-helix domain-containing protein [Nonomuraea solani]|uniref:Helix-turn-helix domain-containing protein n=1 Tax=Nonomuraea solani TaxID=1144553 RepID=A0A1H5UW77_9ACTN|nr:helix-turn-helix transcriptional regulator [Nonomuraea solani]SEF79335.1 Helix-turn-helix domain-containing protein [Nonomuraea solani]
MPNDPELDYPPYDDLGSVLRVYRTARGWTQRELGRQINFSGAYVGFVERGKRPPGKDFVARCEKALWLDGELMKFWKRPVRKKP